MTAPEPTPARCYNCLRPQNLCYCEDLPRVATKTRIVILQHPHERTHPFGTARLAKLCMPNVSVHVPVPGFTGTLEKQVEVPADAAVLFPHPDAQDLETLPQEQWPSTLIAIDGTWSHAKRLYRENTWLHKRPHVRLSPAEPSRYRIRKEPKPDYISTLEAIVAALRIIEPDANGLDDLITAFDRMIDRQIASRSSRVSGRFKSVRQRDPKALTPLLADPRLVVTYAESGRPGGHADKERELLHWVAARIDSDEIFEAIIQPQADHPTDEHLFHLGISSPELAGGETLSQARDRFLAFVRGDAPIAAWTDTTFEWGRHILPTQFNRVLLKHNYCNARQRRAGYLEDVVEREELQAADLGLRGRAGSRLTNALAVARWLRNKQAMLTK